MPHFYFSLRRAESEPEINDLDLPDADMARKEALQAFGDMLREMDSFGAGARWEMEVTAEDGGRVALLNFSAEGPVHEDRLKPG